MTEQIVFPPKMRSLWLRLARDPVLFAQTLLPLSPHPGQERWLRGARQNVNILVPANRWGKSTVIAMKHIHKCMFKVGARPGPGLSWLNMRYETISGGMSADQAEIVFSEARRMLSHPAVAPFVSQIRSTPFPRIKFYNGSVFHCRSFHDEGKYVDGHAYRFISVDEAGWIDNLKNLVTGVLLMRLAGGGELDLIGTPKGYGDLYWYANRGLRGVEGYYTQRGSVFDNPFLPEEDIRRRDLLMSHADQRLRDQVIYGEFVSLEGMAFTQDQLDQAFDPEMPAHQDPVDGHKYVQAWDLGRRTDFTVGITLDVTTEPYQLVDFVRLNKVPWESIYDLIRDKAQLYRVHAPRIDATGPQGDVIEEELTKRGIFVDAYKASTQMVKTNLVNTLQSALDYGRQTVGVREVLDESGNLVPVPDFEGVGGTWGLLRMPAIPQLLDEMGTYQLDDKNLVQDAVMALALAVHVVYDGGVLYKPLLGSIYGDAVA